MGGQLIYAFGLTLPQVFYLTGISMTIMAVLCRVLYKVFGKKWEIKLAARKEEILAEIEATKELSNCTTTL